MKTNKAILVTLFRGANYGTVLQAFAMKNLVKKSGYDPNVLWYKSSSLVKGRDLRIKKILGSLLKLLLHPRLVKKTAGSERELASKVISPKTVDMFNSFCEENLGVLKMTYSEMKHFARSDDVKFAVCGSDQIWNSTLLYLDPAYFLRFVPEKKRISYAPSLGRGYIPDYNRKKLLKYISGIPHVSVREQSGKELIEKELNRECKVVLDPTLVLSKQEWQDVLSDAKIPEKPVLEDYILLYFLDEPTDAVIGQIKKYSEENKVRIVSMLHSFEVYNGLGDILCLVPTPFEFVRLIEKARAVFTDSFHGVAFSVNMNSTFFSFERQYGVSADQSTRITGLLQKLGIEERYIGKDKYFENFDDIDYGTVNESLEKERENSMKYLTCSITDVIGGNGE